MSYSTSNPPYLTGAGPLTGAGKVWAYRSTDPHATVDTIGYFSNGYDLGMRRYDLVFVTDTSADLTMLHQVITSVSTAVDLGTGTTVGSSANSD